MDFGLSVLDVSPVSSGVLRSAWAPQHARAGPARRPARLPAVLAGRAPQPTEHRQLCSGDHDRTRRERNREDPGGRRGIMLPNHALLKVAETFRVLEALHPKRIDLGIGRASGTDPVTATALRRSHDGLGAEDFPERFGELLAFSGDGFPEDHPFQSVVAMPADVALPSIWLLGSSGYSARAAGQMGFGYAFAAHFSPADPAPAMRAYRDSFEPSEGFERPSAILAVAVVCGETDELARILASSMELAWVRMRSGKPGPLPSPEEAMAYPYTPADRHLANAYRYMQVVGNPRTVRARLEELAEHTAADEVMVTTNIYDHAERLRSYERLAEVLDIAMPGK